MLPSPAPTADRVTVVIATRHPAIRTSLWELVQGEPDLHPIGAAGDLRDAVRLLHDAAPDVVLVDAAILGESDLRWLATLRSAAPDAACIVLGMGDHPAYVEHARRAGASDYVRVDLAVERLPEAIRAAAPALRS